MHSRLFIVLPRPIALRFLRRAAIRKTSSTRKTLYQAFDQEFSTCKLFPVPRDLLRDFIAAR